MQRFFDPHQRITIEAAMARIIPTDDQPGAREAGTIDFVDRFLSGIDFIYAKPDGHGFEKLEGKRADAWRSRIEKLRATYVGGIADLDQRSRDSFSVDFVSLTDRQQDDILTAIENAADAAADIEPATAGPALQQTSTEMDLPFLPLLILHTRQGFYADPVYGGNRGQIGWKVIGFPGPASMEEVFTGRYSTLAWFAGSAKT